MFGGIMASMGNQFLQSFASNHGETFGSRTMRPFTQFETPWGKGPYWNIQSIPHVTRQNARKGLLGTVEGARQAGLHPLFALGSGGGGGFQGGPVRGGDSPRVGSGGGAGVPRTMTDAQVEAVKASAANDYAQASYWDAKAAQLGQAKGGDPNAGFGGEGVTITKLPQGRPIAKRPLIEEPRKSVPMRMEVIADDGYRYRPISKDVGDEMAELDLFYQGMMRMTKQARLALPREVRRGFATWKRKREERLGRNLRSPEGKAYLKRRYGGR